jgi:hypothetical protein
MRHIDGDFLDNRGCNLGLALGERPGPLGEHIVSDGGEAVAGWN